MGILENVAARRAAETVVVLMEEEATDPEISKDNFWKIVVGAIPKEYVPVQASPGLKPMTDMESQGFENTCMEFGKHNGERMGDVPIDYLFWLDEQDNFSKLLKRYLLSKRVQREQG